MEECTFCAIVKNTIPAEKVFEDERFVVFKDINPVAPVHLLLIPRRHIESIETLQDSDRELIGRLFLLARDIARKKHLAKPGYKLLFRVGHGGGQIVPHLHLHLLGGWGDQPKTLPL